MNYNKNNTFAKILRGEIPCKKVYENDYVLSFHDVNPQKKMHVLVIPKGEYIDLDDFHNRASEKEIIEFNKSITHIVKVLEIKKKQETNQVPVVPSKTQVYLEKKKDIDINKFFYRQVGKDHFWRDRLLWSDKEWQKYLNNKNLETGIMKHDGELIGFYEQEFHVDKNEIELIQMGVLKKFQGKKFGSFLLEYIIYMAFNKNVEKIKVHTCSLDHKHALNNYLSKGFKIFKEETIDINF